MEARVNPACRRLLHVAGCCLRSGKPRPLGRGAVTEGIQFQAEQIRETLAELFGPEFNQTYLEKQVELHNVALDTVRNQLLPNAEQREVTQLLEQAIPKLQHHRDLAQQGL
jgi:predicted outer membrane protein